MMASKVLNVGCPIALGSGTFEAGTNNLELPLNRKHIHWSLVEVHIQVSRVEP